MYIPYNGYSHVQYSATERKVIVQRLINYLPSVMEYIKADSIAVTGKSGISFMFALLEHIDIPFMTIRKPGENCHGETIEGTLDHNFQRYLILDDFVDSGDTVRRIISTLEKSCTYSYSSEQPYCVGVVEYTRGNDRYWLEDYHNKQRKVAVPRNAHDYNGSVPIFSL